MTQLCEKHYEARFIRLNAEKAPFLTERLKIKVMPTILMTKDSVVCDRWVFIISGRVCTDFENLGRV